MFYRAVEIYVQDEEEGAKKFFNFKVVKSENQKDPWLPVSEARIEVIEGLLNETKIKQDLLDALRRIAETDYAIHVLWLKIINDLEGETIEVKG